MSTLSLFSLFLSSASFQSSELCNSKSSSMLLNSRSWMPSPSYCLCNILFFILVFKDRHLFFYVTWCHNLLQYPFRVDRCNSSSQSLIVYNTISDPVTLPIFNQSWEEWNIYIWNLNIKLHKIRFDDFALSMPPDKQKNRRTNSWTY